MAGFDVTVPAVTRTAATAATIGSELQCELEAVRAQVEGILAGDWLGRAASSFERAWREWHGEARDVLVALTDLVDALRATATAYGNSDEAARTTLLVAAS